jgi:hypothetical protein
MGEKVVKIFDNAHIVVFEERLNSLVDEFAGKISISELFGSMDVVKLQVFMREFISEKEK